MYHEDEFEPTQEFPNVLVNPLGQFFNEKTDKMLATSRTSNGHLKINLTSGDGRYGTRSVARIVADTFLGPPPNERFDTIIHLNGDLSDCRAANLMWRPRWYAIKFHKQFSFESFNTGYKNKESIVDIDTGKTYGSIYEVCTTEGLYYFDVQDCLFRNTLTPVTGHRLRYA